jgi:chromosome segregation ATPase
MWCGELLVLAIAALSCATEAVVVNEVSFLRGAAARYEEDPSAEVREEFVRKCRVTMNVRSSKMLPVEPLERFCSMTKDVVECRQKLVERLKEDHADGVSLKPFCGAVYDWFQAKYGMFCPAQCRKLQCRPTCAWLKRQKALKEETKALKADLRDSDESRLALKKLASAVKEADQDLTMQNRSVDQAKVSLGRAERDEEEVAEELKGEQEKYERMKNESLAGQATVNEGEAAIALGEKELRDLEWEIDAAQVNHTAMVRELKRVEEELDSKSKLHLEKEAKVVKGEEDMQVLEAAADKDGDAVNEASEAVTDQQAVVQKRKDALQRAKDEFQSSKLSGNHTEETVKGYEALVKDQKKKLDKAVSQLDEVITKEREAKQKLKWAKEAIDRKADDLQDLKSKTADAKLKLTELNASFANLQAEADTFEKEEVKARQDRADAMRKANKEKEKEQETAKTTLEFSRKAAIEQKETVAEVENKRTAAASKVQAAEDSLALSEEILSTKSGDLEKLISQEREQVSNFEAQYGELEKRLEENKNSTDALREDTPEIVHQHGLGLLIEEVVSAMEA